MKRTWDDDAKASSSSHKEVKRTRYAEKKGVSFKSGVNEHRKTHLSVVPPNLVFTPESLQLTAEAMGLIESAEKQLKTEAAKEIANRINDFLRRLIQDAINIAAMNKHNTLTCVDLNMALQYNGIPPYFGADDLMQRPIYRSHKVGGREIFSKLNSEFISVDNENEGTLSFNHDVILSSHWLLLDNVQPKVPENPILPPTLPVCAVNVQEISGTGDGSIGDKSSRPAISDGTDGSGIVSHGNVLQMSQHPIAKQVLDVREKKQPPNEAVAVGKIQVETTVTLAHRMRKQKLKLPSLITHSVDLEMQLYYNDLTEAITGNDELRRTEAYESLKRDPSIQPLLPQLTTFICEGIRMCLLGQSMFELFFLIRMVNQLCENEALQLQDHLHRLLPSLFSCCVCKQLCARPLESNHCKLRSYASKCLAKLCNKYQIAQPEIIRDVSSVCARTLKSFLNPRSLGTTSGSPTSLCSAYGAFVLLCELGVRVVREVLLPLLPAIYEICRPSNQSGSSVGMGGSSVSTGLGTVSAAYHAPSSSSIVSSVGGVVLTPMDSQVANALEKEFHDRLAPIIAEIRRGNPPEMETLEQYRKDFGPNLGTQLHANIVLGRSSHRSVNHLY